MENHLKYNIESAENNGYELVSTLNNVITQGNRTVLPDVYIFHELTHILHYFDDEKNFNKLSDSVKVRDMTFKNIPSSNIMFPSSLNNQYPDYEDMRTIKGILYNSQRNIVFENSYRHEKKRTKAQNKPIGCRKTTTTRNA